MTPKLIQSWLFNAGSGGSKVRSVEDFICCLPKEYQSNYVVSHSSVAGQNGTPNDPRIFMFGEKELEGPSKPPSLILTANGGHPGMNQGSSIEMSFLNPQTKQLEFYDLSFDEVKKKLTMSEANPSLCMNCHGDSGKVPAGGPKFIFDAFPHWPRFVGGADKCNAEDSKLQNAASDRAVRSIKTNSRFKCLDKSSLEVGSDSGSPSERYAKQSHALVQFDGRLHVHDSNQHIKWLRSLPKYEKYKYFLLGSRICPKVDFHDWIPRSTFENIRKNIDVDSHLKLDGDLSENFKRGLLEKYNNELATQKAQLQNLENDPEKLYREGIDASQMRILCDGRVPSESELVSLADQASKSFKSKAMFGDKKFTAKDPEILYLMDESIRGSAKFSTPESGLRFFLEGENYGTYMVQSTFRSGDLGKSIVKTEDILVFDPSDSELRNLYKTLDQGPKGMNCFKTEEKFLCPKNPETLCEDLKALSNSQFNNASAKALPGVR